jgi:serine/threonine protein kinase
MGQIFDASDVATALGVPNVQYLGTGSYGETWRAQRAGRDCAVKIIHRDGYDLARLDREIEGYRRVAHENVVELYSAYPLVVGSAQRVAMEFEYINGGDLSTVIGQRQISADELRGLASGLLHGVEALHAADLLHRDLKPANIALREGRLTRPVILDLGLAKLLDIESITRYPTRLGTPLYMAPEQIRGERALRASDLWAVGVILYETATGIHPFYKEGESLTIEEAIQRMTSPVSMPSGVDDKVADLILRCLSEPAYKRGTVAKAVSRLKDGGQ